MPPAVSVVTIYCGSQSFTFQYTNHAFKLSESGSSSQLKKYCRLSLDLCVKILSVGDCWSDLCEKRPGCLMLLACCQQLESADPKTTRVGCGWAHQQKWWHLFENIFKKGQNAAQQWGMREESVRNSPASTKVRAGGRSVPGTRAEIPLQLVEETIVE